MEDNPHPVASPSSAEADLRAPGGSPTQDNSASRDRPPADCPLLPPDVANEKCPVNVTRLLLACSLVGLSLARAFGDEPKNHDFDVIDNEALVPAYQLPPLLVSSEGKPITTPEE